MVPGRGSWEGRAVLGGGLALIPQVLLGLGGDQREGLWKREGFSGQACPEIFTCADQHLCSRAACPLNQNIPDESHFLSPNLPEPVGAPEQEERGLTGCSPPASGGAVGCTTRGPSDPGQTPAALPADTAPAAAGWGLPQRCSTSARKAEGKTRIQTISLPTSRGDPGAGENPESAAGSRAPRSVLCNRGMAVEQSWGWMYASAAPRSAGRCPGPRPASQPPAHTLTRRPGVGQRAREGQVPTRDGSTGREHGTQRLLRAAASSAAGAGGLVG